MAEIPRDHILFDEKRIQERVREIGRAISRDYEGKDLVLIGVLKGAVVFLADLVRAIAIPHTFDFIGASSYGASQVSGGQVSVTKDVTTDLAGKHLLVIEDIYDSGRTLEVLVGLLQLHKPASVELCCFAVKDRPRDVDRPVKYKGFDVPDTFVVGYGLDYDEKFRNLRYLAVYQPENSNHSEER